jgi:hypothetical protein
MTKLNQNWCEQAFCHIAEKSSFTGKHPEGGIILKIVTPIIK